MSVEYIRDVLKMDQMMGANPSQALVEGDITVPDGKPGIVRILQIDGKITVNRLEVVQDKIMMDGMILFSILYVSEENHNVQGLDAVTNFNHSIEVLGAKPLMNGVSMQEIEHIEFTVSNSRRVKVRAIVNLDAKVTMSSHLEAIKDIQGISDIQVLKEKVKSRTQLAKGTSQCLVKEDVEIAEELPSIGRILKNEGKAVIREVKAADNKVLVSGDVLLSILYLSEEGNESIQFINKTIPFHHAIEISGAYQGIEVETTGIVREIYPEIQENNAGEQRILNMEIVVDLQAAVFEIQEKEWITDAYSPTVQLELDRSTVDMVQVAGENTIQQVIKESIQLPEDLPKIQKVLVVQAKPITTDESIENGKIIVEGILELSVLYLSEDSLESMQNYPTEVPFRCEVEVAEIQPGMDLETELSIDHVSFNVTSLEEIEITVALEVTGKTFTHYTKDIVVQIKELESISRDEPFGLKIYFAQAGDSLWNIAKQFHMTVEEILRFNAELDREEIKPGARILLYHKYIPVV